MQDTQPVSETSIDVLSQKIKLLRRRAQLTLKQLSLRSGISVSTLSKIENGRLSPTYEKIAALAYGLSVDVGELFRLPGHETHLGRRSISSSATSLVHDTRPYRYTVLHNDLAHKRFIPLLATVKAHERHEFPKTLHRHHGEEFIYVLSGQITLLTDLYAPQTLNPGDSCYFDSGMGHAFLSTSAEDAQILWISCTLPSSPE
ncbi:helix-turn-helix domain-containing protein [Neisseria leonii]|uniref:helix-turn-helix domain-containing protein n=1 Tax=Neisseria leonii TaxID=2995413 RepID=UPI00237B6C4F|nr:XRE family transcriptional regulator [Neisseria sp. 3986]MDD9325104.1 XRE family transcriptional regulator [Neisseria sp. 3986]